ncbi:MAG: hypothetical protein ACON4T_02715 [Synechococcus sp.]
MTEPLTREMVERIDATLLPSLDRHHLRLLAHCLGSFQQMVPPDASRAIPSREQQNDWCLRQPLLRDDPQFGTLLLQQFAAAAVQLEALAQTLKVAPLDLTLDHLIAQAVANAQRRLNTP